VSQKVPTFELCHILTDFQISYAFQQCRNFEYRLRFDRVTERDVLFFSDLSTSVERHSLPAGLTKSRLHDRTTTAQSGRLHSLTTLFVAAIAF